MKKSVISIIAFNLLVSNSYADEISELRVIKTLNEQINKKINLNNSTSYASFNNSKSNCMEIEPNTNAICEIRNLWNNGKYQDSIDAIFKHKTANCGEYAIISGVMLKGSGEFQSIIGMGFTPGDHAFVIAKGKSNNYYLFDAWASQYGKIDGEDAITRLQEEQDLNKPCRINEITNQPLCIYPETIFGTQNIPKNNYVSSNSHSVYSQSQTEQINFIYDNGHGYNYINNKLIE